MNAQMQLAQANALVALNAAKAIREQYKTTGMTAEATTSFNAAMADFTAANTTFQAFKTQEESFSNLDKALETYTAPASEAFYGNPAIGTHAPAAQTAAQATAARATHKDAFRRFLRGGAAMLQPREAQAYLAGASQMFGAEGREGLMNILPQEQHALVGTVDSLGGFLVPDEYMSEFITEVAGFTVVRPLARVKQTSKAAAVFMTLAGSGNNMYSSGVTGHFRGEGWVVGGAALPTQDQPRFGRERIPVHIWAPDLIELTMELMDDSSINLDAEVRRLLAETRGIDEDSAFLLGTGIGSPMGILTEATAGNITSVNSGASNAQSWPGLVNLYTALPAQYRAKATWAMNSLTYGLLLQLEDTEGHLIFPANTLPTSLFGRPMVCSEFIPDGNSNNNYSMIFGDFSYYGIADRMDMRIIRLVERFAPNIAIMAIARVGGQVLKTNPFRVQKVNA